MPLLLEDDAVDGKLLCLESFCILTWTFSKAQTASAAVVTVSGAQFCTVSRIITAAKDQFFGYKQLSSSEIPRIRATAMRKAVNNTTNKYNQVILNGEELLDSFWASKVQFT